MAAMRIPGRRRRFWPALAALVGVAVTISLGNWQLNRAAEKRALKAQVDAYAAQPPIHVSAVELPAADIEHRRVEARGSFDPRHAVYVDNRLRHGVPGYHVVMPLKLAGGERHVLVNRGWVARRPDRRDLPEVRTPRGDVAVSGMAVIPGLRVLELSEHVTEGRIWQNLTIDRYRAAMPIAIQPFVIRQDSALDDGLVREWDPPDFGIDKHYGYAFQWFGLAATIVIFYAVTQFRRSRAKAA
ncbi:MAG: SURF1 family protein [Burkholderiales bacterium]